MKYLRCFGLFLLLASRMLLAQSNPVPLINQPLVPASTSPGGAGFTLTLNGTGFVSDSLVNWNNVALATTFVNNSQLTAVVPASDIATASTASVTVSSPGPVGGTSNVVFFDIATPVAAPTLTKLFAGPFVAGWGSAVTGDFNGDGKLDLAWDADFSLQPPINNLNVQLGNGDGSFQDPIAYPAGTIYSMSVALVTGDFNRDGKLDLAVANAVHPPLDPKYNTISILLGNGDGTFQPQATFPTAAVPLALVVGDFNADGNLDIATGNRFGEPGDVGGYSILLGNGDGTLQSHVDYETGIWIPAAITTGDFNGDGKLDLVYPVVPSGFYLAQGNGDGTFLPAVVALQQNIGGNPASVVAADLNGDGKLDLVTAYYSFGAFVALGNGDGTFQPGVAYGTGQRCEDVALGDFNADGKLDVVLGNYKDDGAQPGFSILLGNGDGTLQTAIDFPTDGVTGDQAPVALPADYNGDGRLDLAAPGTNSNNFAGIVVSLQGQFPALTPSPDGVGFPETAVGTTSAPETITLTNTGTATLTLSSITITGGDAGDFAQTNSCGPSLAPSANCQVSVTFTPSAPGNPLASLTITDNAPGSPHQLVLAGNTPPAPIASLSPQSLTFPAQYVGTTGLPQTVTVTNTGAATLNISSVTASPADYGLLNACGNSVAPGTSCSIGVFFDPTASGSRTGTLTVFDDAFGGSQTVSLSGTGQDFSMTTSGSTTVTVAAGQTATYHLTVAPGGGFNQTVSLSCTGAPSQSTCSVSPGSLPLDGSSSATVTVTVTTVGASAGLGYPSGFRSAGSRLASWMLLSGLPSIILLTGFGSWAGKR